MTDVTIMNRFEAKAKYCDIFQINLLLPTIEIWKKKIDDFETESRVIKLDVPTKFFFAIDEDMWNFVVSLFGFGIQIFRQWKY